MGQLGDNWATWRAIFAAVGLLVLLIWALSLKKQEDSRNFIQTETVTATIKEIIITESDSRYAATKSYLTYLSLADGNKIKFTLLRPPPKVGSQVPVLIDSYDDGSQYYHYNLMDWQLLETL